MKANKQSLFNVFVFSCKEDTDISKFNAVKCAINFISPGKLVFVIYLSRNIQKDLPLCYLDVQVKKYALDGSVCGKI